MKLVSIQVGRPQTIQFQGKSILTGIQKNRIDGPIQVGRLNIEGDGQADLKVHGGPDKAVYAYSADAYDAWRQMRPHDAFAGGSMGENLTIETLPETKIYVGDVFELGGTVLEACQPRFPCFKLAAKFNDPNIVKEFDTLNRPGVYFRVLQEGAIESGQSLRLIRSDSPHVSIQDLYEFARAPISDPARLHAMLTVKALTDSWRQKIASRLNSVAAKP